MKLIPRPFQEEVILRALERNVYDMDACGAGKTLVGVETAIRLRAKYNWDKPTLIITPKTPRWQWLSTIYQQDVNPHVYIVDGIDPLFDSKVSHSWVIVHTWYANTHPTDIARVRWGAIIVDEAHGYRNRKIRGYHELCKFQCFRKLALSSTPIHKDPSELWAMLHWLYPDDYPAYWTFRNNYTQLVENEWGYKVFYGIKNGEKLAASIAPFTFRRKLSDPEVAPHLPPRIIDPIKVAAPARLLKAHDAVTEAKDVFVEITDEGQLTEVVIQNTLSQINYLRRLISNPLGLGFKFESPKIEWATAFARENPDLNILFLCYYKDTSAHLGELLKVPGLHGSHNQREQIIAKFQAGDSKLLVGTFGTLGVGTDLPMVDVTIVIDLLYQQIQLEQALDRTYRINITSPKFIKLLYIPDTIDDVLAASIGHNWDQRKLVMEYIRLQTAKYKSEVK